MQTPYDTPPANSPYLVDFVKHNASILLFLVLAFGGMMLTFAYFSPDAAEAQAFAFSGIGIDLYAPISKTIPDRIVEQRFAQSPAPFNFAIIVGHQESDSGAVCEDGLQELTINTLISDKVLRKLSSAGYPVVLYDEFDIRLNGFEGVGLISIHADSCGDYGETATGFKVAGSGITDSTPLVDCLNTEYQAATGLGIHSNTITSHMTDYHAFRTIAPGTPAAIIETGFMNLDRQLLTTNSDIPATGIANGIMCYLQAISYGQQ